MFNFFHRRQISITRLFLVPLILASVAANLHAQKVNNAEFEMDYSASHTNNRTPVRVGYVITWIALNSDGSRSPASPNISFATSPCDLSKSNPATGTCMVSANTEGMLYGYSYCAGKDPTRATCPGEEHNALIRVKQKAEDYSDAETIAFTPDGIIGPVALTNSTTKVSAVVHLRNADKNYVEVSFLKTNPCSEENPTHLNHGKTKCTIAAGIPPGPYQFVCKKSYCPDPIIHVESADQLIDLKTKANQFSNAIKTLASQKLQDDAQKEADIIVDQVRQDIVNFEKSHSPKRE